MTEDKGFTVFPTQRPAVVVVSHERSGTHFLMNTLASCYGYVSKPWINLDHPTKSLLEFHSREGICNILLDTAARPIANIVKSHHPTDFFTGQLQKLAQRYVFFYIYRNPVDVMLSYWRFMYLFHHSVEPGPRLADPVSFAQAKPSGHMIRYQTRASDTVLERWARNVESWISAAELYPNIVVVRYEDLNERFESTVKRFSTALLQPPQGLLRPAKGVNVVPPGPADPAGTGIPPDIEALRSLCRDKLGGLMTRLGY